MTFTEANTVERMILDAVAQRRRARACPATAHRSGENCVPPDHAVEKVVDG